MTTGRINQVAALAKRTGRSPPCATALPGDACFVVSRSKQKRLATRPVGARPVPRPRAHQAGNSLSSKPTRGSSRGYQSTIRNTACSIAERAAFRRLPRHASRRPPVARSQASPRKGKPARAAWQPGSSLHSVLEYGLRIAHSYKPALCAGTPAEAGARSRGNARVSASTDCRPIGTPSSLLRVHSRAVQPGASARRSALPLIGLLGSRNGPAEAGPLARRPRGDGDAGAGRREGQESLQSGCLLGLSPFACCPIVA